MSKQIAYRYLLGTVAAGHSDDFFGLVDETLGTLTPREERIIIMRYGLVKPHKTMTLEEIGKEFNVNRERIRQIEAKALRKLRHPSRLGTLNGVFQYRSQGGEEHGQ